MVPPTEAHACWWRDMNAKGVHESLQKTQKSWVQSPDTMFASSSEKLAKTHKPTMDCSNPTPHARAHTGAYIRLRARGVYASLYACPSRVFPDTNHACVCVWAEEKGEGVKVYIPKYR